MLTGFHARMSPPQGSSLRHWIYVPVLEGRTQLAPELCTRTNRGQHARIAPDLCTRAIVFDSLPELRTRRLGSTAVVEHSAPDLYTHAEGKNQVGARFMSQRHQNAKTAPYLCTRGAIGIDS